jgi:hypothetical protein
MPVISAVVINDGAGTPVAFTFTPLGKDEKGVFWFEQTSPTPTSVIGANRIGYRQERVFDAQKRLTGESRVTYTIHKPTLEVLGNSSTGITPPPTVAYIEKCRLEFVLPERGTNQERTDIRAFARNLLGHAMAVSNIDTLQPSY